MATAFLFRNDGQSPPVPELTVHEALSGLFGSISVAAWIFVLVPQLFENYRLRSAAGVSMPFLAIWSLGDATNLLGAALAGLVPTVIALAVYFCLADVVLVGQCIYYNWLNARAAKLEAAEHHQNHHSHNSDATEDEPLLSRRRSSTSSARISAEQRRQSHLPRRRPSSTGSRDGIEDYDEDAERIAPWFVLGKNVGGVVLVILVGAAGWVLAWKSGAWVPPDDDVGNGAGDDSAVAYAAQASGYLSAVLYLGARIPQIIKNWREQSTEGLSLLFFLFAMMGNLTYAASILLHSTEHAYVVTNLPWLIGSLGTVAEDITIFVQFHLYKGARALNGAAVE